MRPNNSCCCSFSFLTASLLPGVVIICGIGQHILPMYVRHKNAEEMEQSAPGSLSYSNTFRLIHLLAFCTTESRVMYAVVKTINQVILGENVSEVQYSKTIKDVKICGCARRLTSMYIAQKML